MQVEFSTRRQIFVFNGEAKSSSMFSLVWFPSVILEAHLLTPPDPARH